MINCRPNVWHNSPFFHWRCFLIVGNANFLTVCQTRELVVRFYVPGTFAARPIAHIRKIHSRCSHSSCYTANPD